MSSILEIFFYWETSHENADRTFIENQSAAYTFNLNILF